MGTKWVEKRRRPKTDRGGLVKARPAVCRQGPAANGFPVNVQPPPVRRLDPGAAIPGQVVDKWGVPHYD